MLNHPQPAVGTLWTPTGFNRAAIFRQAWDWARSRQNSDRNGHFYTRGPAPKNVRAYFAQALRDVWAEARKEASQARMPASDHSASLALAERTLWAAQMIDSTHRSFAVQISIRQRFAITA